MTNSKQKGSAGERELALFLREHGLTARRTQQYCGASPDSSDVVVKELQSVHFECKRVEKLNIENAMEQAIRDAKEKIPVVAHRKNRGEWLGTVRLPDLLALLKKLVVLLCLLPCLTEAQTPIRVHLVKVSGDHQLSLPDAATVWDSAAALVAGAGVDLRLAKVTLINDIKPKYGTLDRREARLYFWLSQARRRGYFKNVDTVHFMFPPIHDKDQYWFAGLAVGECVFRQNAMSYSNTGISKGGTVQLRKSAVAVAHEILHTVGAKHTTGTDLMNTGALALADRTWPLQVAPITINEVNLCQQKRKARNRQRKAARAASL